MLGGPNVLLFAHLDGCWLEKWMYGGMGNHTSIGLVDSNQGHSGLWPGRL